MREVGREREWERRKKKTSRFSGKGAIEAPQEEERGLLQREHDSLLIAHCSLLIAFNCIA